MKGIRFRYIFVMLGSMALLALSSLAQSTAENQKAATQPANDVLVVQGVGLREIKIDRDELAAMPRRVVKVKDHDGEMSSFEGVMVGDLLKKAGFTFGQHFRGPRMADYLIAQAADGYRVVFALPELDTEFSERIVIVADRCDGKPLSERDGPFRMVVSDEKKHARWVRQTTSLTVATATP